MGQVKKITGAKPRNFLKVVNGTISILGTSKTMEKIKKVFLNLFVHKLEVVLKFFPQTNE